MHKQISRWYCSCCSNIGVIISILAMGVLEPVVPGFHLRSVAFPELDSKADLVLDPIFIFYRQTLSCFCVLVFWFGCFFSGFCVSISETHLILFDFRIYGLFWKLSFIYVFLLFSHAVLNEYCDPAIFVHKLSRTSFLAFWYTSLTDVVRRWAPILPVS